LGNRCSAYFAGCIVCESYKHLDEHGRFPTFDEACAICDEANRLEFAQRSEKKLPKEEATKPETAKKAKGRK